MRRATLTSLALVAAFLPPFGSPATPASAGSSPAKTGSVFITTDSGPSYSFSIHGEDGFHLNLEAQGDGFVALSVTKPRQLNLYATQGAVSEKGEVRARFARFGRVALEFRPVGKPKFEQPFPRCHGKPFVHQPGVFAGIVRFRGERGFAEFDADHARGEMVTPSRWRCPSPGGGGEGPETDPSEEAVIDASPPDGNPSFYAAGHRRAELPGSVFIASDRRKVGGVSEVREAIAVTRSPKAFEFDDVLSSATVRPGFPFHGSGVFQRGVGGVAATWTGSLRVSFLGGDVALTGDRIEASLERPKYRRLATRPLSLPWADR